MTRLWAPVLLLGIISGCTGSGTGNRPTDPFFGRTRIEPPGTGWAQGQRSPDPYYSKTGPAAGRYGTTGTSSGASVGTLGPPVVTVPGANSNQTPAGVQPPGGWQAPSGVQTPAGTQPATKSPAPSINLSAPGGTSSNSIPFPGTATSRPGDRVEIPLAARQDADTPLTMASRSASPSSLGPASASATSPANAAAAASSTTASAASLAATNPRYGNNATSNGLAGRERIVRVLEPRPAAASGSSTMPRTVQPGLSPATTAARQSVDIMDLPPAKSSNLYRGSQSSDAAGQVRFVSAAEPATDSSARSVGRDNSATSAAASQAGSSSPVKRLDD